MTDWWNSIWQFINVNTHNTWSECQLHSWSTNAPYIYHLQFFFHRVCPQKYSMQGINCSHKKFILRWLSGLQTSILIWIFHPPRVSMSSGYLEEAHNWRAIKNYPPIMSVGNTFTDSSKETSHGSGRASCILKPRACRVILEPYEILNLPYSKINGFCTL